MIIDMVLYQVWGAVVEKRYARPRYVQRCIQEVLIGLVNSRFDSRNNPRTFRIKVAVGRVRPALTRGRPLTRPSVRVSRGSGQSVQEEGQVGGQLKPQNH